MHISAFPIFLASLACSTVAATYPHQLPPTLGDAIASLGLVEDSDALQSFLGHLSGPPADCSKVPSRPPIVFVAPLTGSQLNATLREKPKVPHFFCSRNSRPYRVWLPPAYDFISPISDCEFDNLRLIPSVSDAVNATSTGHREPPAVSFYSPPGVSTDLTFDDIRGLLTLGQVGKQRAGVYLEAAVVLTRVFNYTIGCNLFGVPYDWRTGPGDWNSTGHRSAPPAVGAALGNPATDPAFSRLEKATEDAFRLGNAASVRVTSPFKVTIIGTSLGAPFVTSFLSHRASSEWKARHIGGFVSLSGVYGGAPLAANILMSSPGHFRPMPINKTTSSSVPNPLGSRGALTAQRSFAVTYWLLPDPAVYGNDPVVTTHNGSVTFAPGDAMRHAVYAASVAGAQRGADEVGAVLPPATAVAVYDAARVFTTTSPPMVPTLCVRGTGIPTVRRVDYTVDFFSEATYVFGDGDGDVPAEALTVCEGWADQQKAPVTAWVEPGLAHASSLTNRTQIGHIAQWILRTAGAA
eukprot:TRINITY_DN182_c0_g1_i1.p1 TRINITY_DN182_c0_g1~~TRINITY_DN182_c0_g1_i1.p1  ORF type:complete len:522 (+),score=89.39 TRINITY_DN182_c0_g1_i1:133-1698(+)